MNNLFSLKNFQERFPNNDSCLDEIKQLKYPKGISCRMCRRITTHYRVFDRPAFTCKVCRSQTFPLKDTIFEKSSTPLRTWFYAMFLMTQSGGDVSIRTLEDEINVTYKTAWRIFTSLHALMEQNNGDLLSQNLESYSTVENKERTWTFFNTIEIRVAQKKDRKA